jgi:hypothetical protein
MTRPKVRPSPIKPIVSRVGNPKEGNQYGTDAQLDALRQSLKMQTKGKASQGKVQDILERIKRQFGDAEARRAIREFNASFKNIPRDASIPKNPRHG